MRLCYHCIDLIKFKVPVCLELHHQYYDLLLITGFKSLQGYFCQISFFNQIKAYYNIKGIIIKANNPKRRGLLIDLLVANGLTWKSYIHLPGNPTFNLRFHVH